MTAPGGARVVSAFTGAPRTADGIVASFVGLGARFVAALWGASRFPPAEDGHFYHVIATRIARGLGYTWAWPDGSVTYAAHYPVGYPALIGAVYAVFGEAPRAAMLFNAVIGAVAVFAVHRVAAQSANRLGALGAALAVALHPGLVFYTPALMTEGVAAALIVIAAAIAVSAERSSFRSAALVGVVMGAATLVRPQSLLIAPFFGALLSARTISRRLCWCAFVTSVALAVCIPWTLRNCTRMHSCALVSANGGWNLFIGAAPGATGAWVPLETLGVPEECKTVWGEAEKDRCFGYAGVRAILRSPGRWLALAPAKLATTFDYTGAAGWYLHSSNPNSFDDAAKRALGVVETVWERLVVLAGLLAVGRAAGPFRVARRSTAWVASAFLLVRAAWIAHMGLVVLAALLGRHITKLKAAAVAASVVFATALTHVVFFGAGRYSLVCFPVLAALAGTVLTAKDPASDTAR